MHENKFEKQVHEKMDQLGFDPPDGVWTQVDREINKDKERRRSIFWIFLLSGCMFAGGAAYLVINHFVPGKKITVNSAQNVIKHQDVLQKENTLRGEQRPIEKIEKSPIPERSTQKYVAKKSEFFRSGNQLSAATQTVIQVKKVKRESEKSEVLESNSELKSGNLSQAPLLPGGSAESVMNKENPKAAPVIVEKTNKTVSADSSSVLKSAKEGDQASKKSPWTIIISGSAGVSNMNQALFQPQNTASLNYPGYFPASGGSLPVAVNHVQSGTSAGFSFAVGVSVQRKLSKRVSILAGLGYHNYSTKIHAGAQIDSTLTVYSFSAQPSSVSAYFRNTNGKDYTNQYHFIELPVNLSFQLNKSRKNPLNWEGGFSLNWLVSSNALHYDPYNNVYFENSQLFNKIQWDAQTAILIGFPVHDHTIQLGPQIQYGLSSLLKNSSSYPGHLIYYGLKFSFNP